MDTQLSADNPHQHNRYGFVWEQVLAGSTAHLDYGCYEGDFLMSLHSKGLGRLIGVDVNQDAIDRGRTKHSELDIQGIRPNQRLPFDDASFSSISIMDVIEHIADQKRILDDLYRVLKPGGRFLVTVPGQHFFSFLDFGNFKFRFPRLHRWWYTRRHSREEYEFRYVSNPYGLIGDVEADKAWHEHFSQLKLRLLLERSKFEVEQFDGAGFFARPISGLHLLAGRRLLNRMAMKDNAAFKSTHLFCLAKKPDA